MAPAGQPEMKGAPTVSNGRSMHFDLRAQRNWAAIASKRHPDGFKCRPGAVQEKEEANGTWRSAIDKMGGQRLGRSQLVARQQSLLITSPGVSSFSHGRPLCFFFVAHITWWHSHGHFQFEKERPFAC